MKIVLIGITLMKDENFLKFYIFQRKLENGISLNVRLDFSDSFQ